MFYKFARFLGSIFFWLFYPTKVIGAENIPDKRAIIACNHKKWTDSLILGLSLRRKSNFMVKQELFKCKLLEYIITKLHGFPVDRSSAGLSTIKKSLEILNNEELLCIFPEGTRKNKIEDALKLKNGTVMIALKANAPIVPVMFAEKQRIFKKNYLIIGKPWNLEEFNASKLDKETLVAAGQVLTQKMTELRNNFKENS